MKNKTILFALLTGLCHYPLGWGMKSSYEGESITVEFEMVYFERGRFIMGSPEDEKDRASDEEQVEVFISRNFEIGKYEITQKQWFAVMDDNPSFFSKKTYCNHDYIVMTNKIGKKVGMCPNNPVENISRKYVELFLNKLNKRDGIWWKCKRNPRSKDCWRLPTEAEWEYAAKSGTTTPYSFGENSEDLDNYGWYEKNSRKQTHRVGMKKANPKGLHDMYGNVSEWTMDNYKKKLPGRIDPLQEEGKYPVVRGGGWGHDARLSRSADRSRYWGGKYGNLGFRLVRSLLGF